MRDGSSQSGRSLRTLALATILFALCRPASAAEITGFVSGAGPSAAWQRGYGASVTITLFNLVHGELEGLSQGSDLPDTRLTSVAGKAYLGPSIGRLVPYAGLGLGVYHWGREADDDNAQYSLAFAGLKVKLPLGIVLRGEYQWVDLEDAPSLQFDERVLVGVGLGF